MEVNVSARNCRVPEQVAEMAKRRVLKLSRYHLRANSADVVFSEEKRSRDVELVVRIDGTANVVARGRASDFRSALDEAVDHVARKLRRLRERARDHRAEGLPGSLRG